MRRSWDAAREKVDREGMCRRCGRGEPLEAAHVVPRSRINADGGAEHPDNIVPLCPACHQAQHAGHLELLPLLTRTEQSYAARLVGLAEAYRRTTSGLP